MFLQTLHGFGQSRTLTEKILGIQNYFSLEIVASKDTGIRYLLRCSEKQHKNLDRIITTHMPEVIIKVVNDPLVTVKASIMSLLRIRQSAHYMYPLVRYERDDTHDPIGYITGAMTKLQANEQFIYQVTISPRQLRASKKLRKKIVANENLIFEYHNRMPSLLNRTFGIINKLLFGLADTISLVYHTDTQPIVTRRDVELQRQTEVAKRTRPERTLSYFEYEMVDEISKKLSLPLFKVAIRTAITSNDNQARRDRMHAMRGALSLFNNEKLQKLTFKKYRNIVSRLYQLWLMKIGALGDSLHPCILSSKN
jgi:hypothetical protein